MQPLTTMPAGTLYRWVPRTLTWQGKPVLQGACPPEDNSGFFWGGPPITANYILGMRTNHGSAPVFQKVKGTSVFWVSRKTRIGGVLEMDF